MLVTALSIFFLWAQFGCVSLGMVHDGAAETEREQSLVLQKRLDTLEHLLSHQMAKQSELENMLHQQIIKQSEQEKLLHLQQSELFRQEQLLSHCGCLFQQSTAHTQDTLPPVPNGNSVSQRNNSHQDTHVDLLQSTSETSDNGIRLTFHNVTSRSDDSGSLEIVVSGLSQQVTEMRADIQTLKTSVAQQGQEVQDAQSSTFVHWGSSQCSRGSELVYSGAVGGSYYTHAGAATNYLCLTMSPIFGNHPVQSYYGQLYGTEYQTSDSNNDMDPVCAVCRSAYTTTVMIPGTNVCTPGWHLQYSGFLMAQHDSYTGTEYICVDSDLESRPGTSGNVNGALLYHIITRCGSLPCAPYVNNKVVLCAVCSK